jgi:hypothetical protein
MGIKKKCLPVFNWIALKESTSESTDVEIAEMGYSVTMDIQDAVWAVVDWIHLTQGKN